MAQSPWEEGRLPWRRRALSAVAVMTMAVAGTRTTMATASRGDAPRLAVRLHLIDRAGLSMDTRNELMRETLAPWRTADASVAWVAELPNRPAGLGEPKALCVVVEADAGETTDGRHVPMASILFVDGRPTTHITVHAGLVVRRLAEMRLDDRPFSERPRPVQELVLGRVLGRAVAHEVRYFLLGSRASGAKNGSVV